MKTADGPRRLVVISADGLRPDILQRADELGLKIPHLRRLVAAGARAEAVTSVYPSTTYPAHATLVTGVPPRIHGIYSHLASLDPSDRARPWTWFARALNVPALWDVARAAGRRSAAIGWPVSVGATIDYNIPEIWDPSLVDPHLDFTTVARYSTPHLFEEVVRTLGPLIPKPPEQGSKSPPFNPDLLRTEAGLFLWRRYAPDLLLLHLVYYDHQAHRYGPLAPEALSAVEQTDEEVGRVWSVIQEEAGVALVLLSDHGMVPVSREAAPLVVMLDEGLFETDAAGNLQLKNLGAIHAGGSFALYWLEEPKADDRRRLERAVARLESLGAVYEIVDRGKLERLQADPDAEMMLEAAPDHYYSDRYQGPEVTDSENDRGTHGGLPSRPGLEAMFVAVGEGIRAGKSLGRISLTQIAPVLGDLMGLPDDILAAEAGPLSLS